MKTYPIQATLLTLALASLALAAPAQALPDAITNPLPSMEIDAGAPACAASAVVNWETTGDYGAYAIGWIERNGCIFYGVFDRIGSNGHNDDYLFTGVSCPGPTANTCDNL